MIERNDKMQTKHIYKLRELDGFMWGNGKENIFESIYCEDIDGTELQFKREYKNIEGKCEIINMFEVSEKNLDELEFYGLKVVLNEKPKLTRKEREFIEKDIYFARDEDGDMRVYFDKPRQGTSMWWGEVCARANENQFPFITWESGKAWSKAELMELEVVD